MAQFPAPRSNTTWQDMDLMTDILEPVNNMADTNTLFPKCPAPKVSSTNTSFRSSLESRSSRTSEVNLNQSSPDYNQNKSNQRSSQQRMMSRHDRSIYNRWVWVRGCKKSLPNEIWNQFKIAPSLSPCTDAQLRIKFKLTIYINKTRCPPPSLTPTILIRIPSW